MMHYYLYCDSFYSIVITHFHWSNISLPFQNYICLNITRMLETAPSPARNQIALPFFVTMTSCWPFFIYIYSICFVFSRRCPVLVSIPHYLSWLVCFARSMTFTSAARRSCASSVCGIVSLCEEYLHMRINPYALISNRNPFSFPFFHIQATLAPPHSHGRKRNL